MSRTEPTSGAEPTTEVETSVRIAASPATVFAYFTDPERMCRWKGVSAELDARPGGVYRVDVNGGDVALGSYVEVVPDERIVFTWGWEGSEGVPPGSTTVEVTLVPDGDDTIVHLRHSDLPGAEAATLHRQGWEHYLARLEVAAAGRDPGPDLHRKAG